MTARGYLQFATFAAFWACALKIQAGACAAARLDPGTLALTNDSGVVHWYPAVTSWILGALGASLMARKSAAEQRAAAWVLVLAGCAFADVPLKLAGWWRPQVELGLWLAVPIVLCRFWTNIIGPKATRARLFRRSMVSLPLASFAVVALYVAMPRHLWPAPVDLAGMVVYGSPVALGLYASLALGRLRHALAFAVAGWLVASVAQIRPSAMMLA